MKTTTILLFLTFLFVKIGFTQQIPQSPNKYNQNGVPEGQWTILLDKIFNETKNLDSVKYYRVLSFRNGKPFGIVRDYYKSGKLLWEGKLLSYDPLIFDDGICILYFENGAIRSRRNILNNDGNGEDQEYFPNGKLSMTGNLKNGKKEGKWIYYFENGNKQSEGFYQNDIMEGDWIYWYEDGHMFSHGGYKNDLKEGIWKEYKENGDWTEGRFTHDLHQEKWVGWYSDGKKWTEETLLNDNLDGHSIVWSHDGQIIDEGNYKNGQQEGLWTQELDEGRVMKGYYKNGKMDGEWKIYNSDGTFQKSLTFKNGVLQK